MAYLAEKAKTFRMSPKVIKSIRESLSLTQGDFAKLLGVHARTVSKWERGELQAKGFQAKAITFLKIVAEDSEKIAHQARLIRNEKSEKALSNNQATLRKFKDQIQSNEVEALRILLNHANGISKLPK